MPLAQITDINSGARFNVRGFIARNATWSEDIYVFENGTPMTLTGLDWKMTFRKDSEQDNADFTISTDDGTITITTDDDAIPILRIYVLASSLSNMRGDYVADLASRDALEKVILWAHGRVTFTRNPVSWS